MPRPRALLALAAALLMTGLAACNDDAPTDLPAGGTLVTESAAAMRDVKSAHAKIDVEGQVGSLPLKSAEGDLTKEGNAKGNAKVLLLGALLEVQFVVVDGRYFINGLSGGWQEQSPADIAQLYDPSLILNPTKGIANVLATAKDAKTEAADSVNGVDTYRVAVTLDSTAVASVVPGVPSGVTGTLWLDRANKRLVKAVLKVPAPSGDPGTFTLTLSDLDKPVTVSAP